MVTAHLAPPTVLPPLSGSPLRRARANSMHEVIPAARWCVTYGDLTFLREEVGFGEGRGLEIMMKLWCRAWFGL